MMTIAAAPPKTALPQKRTMRGKSQGVNYLLSEPGISMKMYDKKATLTQQGPWQFGPIEGCLDVRSSTKTPKDR